MDSKATFIIPESLALSESGFMFFATTGETFTLNPIGREIFTKLKEGSTLPEIRSFLLENYDIDMTTVERDIEDFINQLKHYKLITTR